MKRHITRNNLKNDTVICTGDGRLQYLLQYQNAYGYNAGGLGWNYDVYSVEGIVICTGYRTVKGDYQVNYEDCKKYDNKAMAIINNYDIDYEESKRLVNELLKDFIKEVLAK